MLKYLIAWLLGVAWHTDSNLASFALILIKTHD